MKKIITPLYSGFVTNFKKNDFFKKWLLDIDKDFNLIMDDIPKRDVSFFILENTILGKDIESITEFENVIKEIENDLKLPIVFSSSVFSNMRNGLIQDYNDSLNYSIFFENKRLFCCSTELKENFVNDNVMKIQDYFHVRDWLGCESVSDIKFEKIDIDIEIFKEQIDDFYNFNEEEDLERVEKIKNKLKDGKELWPIYIDKNSESNFILEGRHKIIAAYELDYKKIPIIKADIIKNKIGKKLKL